MQISIIGTSKITYSHIQALQKKFEIVSISSTRANSKNLKKIASKFKIKTTFTNWRKSIKYYKNKENLVFFITGRIKDNEKILDLCLKTKKKIFIEKPIFLNSKKFKKYLKFNKKVFVGYNRIFYKNIIYLKKKLFNKKRLNILVKCPEIDKKNILSNSCHSISILLFLFGDLKILKKSRNNNFINCSLIDKNKNEISIFFNLKNSDNFSIEIFDKKERFLLSPLENLEIFKDFKLKTFRENRIYSPKVIVKKNEMFLNNHKAGFFRQAEEFKKFLHGKPVLNNIKFSFKIIKLIEKIIY